MVSFVFSLCVVCVFFKLYLNVVPRKTYALSEADIISLLQDLKLLKAKVYAFPISASV